MTVPTPDQIRVATRALRDEASVWDQQAAALDTARAQAAALDMTRLEAGLFQIVVDAYRQTQQHVVARCGEGRDAMTMIAHTLRQVADTYDHEEATQEHRFRNLY